MEIAYFAKTRNKKNDSRLYMSLQGFDANMMWKLTGLDKNQREGEDMLNAIAKNSNLSGIGHRQQGITNDVVITGKNNETKVALAKSDFEGNIYSYMEKLQGKRPQAYNKFLKREQHALNAGTNPYEQEYTMRRLFMNRLSLFIRTAVIAFIFACPHLFFSHCFSVMAVRNYWNCITECKCCSYWQELDVEHCSDPSYWCTWWTDIGTDKGVIKTFGCTSCQECCMSYMFIMFIYRLLNETWAVTKEWWYTCGCEDTSCYNWLYHIREVEYQRSSPENKYRTQLSNRARSRRHHHMVVHELQLDKRNNADKVALYNAMTKQDKMFSLVQYRTNDNIPSDKVSTNIILPGKITTESDCNLTSTTTTISVDKKIDEEIQALLSLNK